VRRYCRLPQRRMETEAAELNIAIVKQSRGSPPSLRTKQRLSSVENRALLEGKYFFLQCFLTQTKEPWIVFCIGCEHITLIKEDKRASLRHTLTHTHTQRHTHTHTHTHTHRHTHTHTHTDTHTYTHTQTQTHTHTHTHRHT